MSVTETFTGLAARLMEKFGTPATLYRLTAVYDKALDQTVKTEVAIALNVVIEPREVEGTAGKKSIETVLKSNTAMSVNDRIVLGGKSYRVKTLEEMAPQGTAFFWSAVVCAS